MSYVKLSAEILDSTVWREAGHVRLVWIAMLAMKNEYQEVMASIPGLADRARVTRAECDDALKVLSSPDPDSRSQIEEGRRIISIPGGWFVVNGESYRRRESPEERRERKAAYMREHRASKSSPSGTVPSVPNVDAVTDHKRHVDNVDRVPPVSDHAEHVTACSESGPAEAEQKQSREEDPPKPPRGQRRRREVMSEVPIPDPFVPTDKHRAYCQQHGLDLELERDAFVGWAEGKTAASWNGTFSTRLANSVRFRRERQGSRPGGNGSPATTADGSAYVYDPGH